MTGIGLTESYVLLFFYADFELTFLTSLEILSQLREMSLAYIPG